MERADRTVMMDQLREDVEELYAGPENAGKPALLPPGLDWKPIGHTAVEAELIDQRQVAREEVAAVYQIPPPMMGILDNATYSNIETQREMAYTMALGPPLVLIEQSLTSMIARDLLRRGRRLRRVRLRPGAARRPPEGDRGLPRRDRLRDPHA